MPFDIWNLNWTIETIAKTIKKKTWGRSQISGMAVVATRALWKWLQHHAHEKFPNCSIQKIIFHGLEEFIVEGAVATIKLLRSISLHKWNASRNKMHVWKILDRGKLHFNSCLHLKFNNTANAFLFFDIFLIPSSDLMCALMCELFRRIAFLHFEWRENFVDIKAVIANCLKTVILIFICRESCKKIICISSAEEVALKLHLNELLQN